MKSQNWWYTMPGWQEIAYPALYPIDETELRAAVLASLQSKGLDLVELPEGFTCRAIEPPLYELSGAHYRVLMKGGGDSWCLFGYSNRSGYFHGVYTSTPIAFDEDTDVVTTLNSRYHIESYEGDRNAVIAEIRKDIERYKAWVSSQVTSVL